MIGKILSFLALVAVIAAAVPRTWVEKPYEGVDPNTLSCDRHAKHLLLLPHHENCSLFYMCAHGFEVLFECAPGGLVFDFPSQTCDWRWAVPCKTRDNPQIEVEEEEEEGSGDEEEEGSGVEEEFFVFGRQIENGRIGDTMAAEASGTVRPVAALSAREANNAVAIDCVHAHSAAKRAAYKGDCQRYWKCVDGVPQTALCSDGLYFNEASLQCDHEANVRCSVQISDELNGEFLIYN